MEGNRVNLHIKDGSGHNTVLEFGSRHCCNRVSHRRFVDLAFLDAGVLSKLALVEASPALSANFESSVPNLFFVGVSAANTFGPLLRFAYGAGFAAPRLSAHLRRTAGRSLGRLRGVRTVSGRIQNNRTYNALKGAVLGIV